MKISVKDGYPARYDLGIGKMHSVAATGSGSASTCSCMPKPVDEVAPLTIMDAPDTSLTGLVVPTTESWIDEESESL